MPVSGPFTVPLTFPVDAEIPATSTKASNIIEQACSNACPSCLLSWSVNTETESGQQICAMAMGCQDGSVFIFHPERRSSSDPPLPKQPRELGQNSRSASPFRHSDSRATSRPASPSMFSPPPFNVTGRSKIVSGITAEKVEAPKNYVDFDDEPGKLKDMLQGTHTAKEKHEIPAAPSDKPALLESHTTANRKDAPKSLLSATNSPSFTPKSLSGPASPSTQSSLVPHSEKLRLLCHVIPPHSGSRHSVSALQLVDGSSFMLMLQQSGFLSIIDTNDGACVSSVQVDEVALLPPSGVEDDDSAQYQWNWNHARIVVIGESKMILASATASSYEMSDDGTLQKSRLAIFALSIQRGSVKLEKFGQWHFNGLAASAGVHHELNGSHTFHFVTWDGHFMIRQIKVLPPAILPAGELNPQSEKVIKLDALAKPFKSMKSQSHEDISLPQPDRASSRIELGEIHDLGLIQSDVPWQGFSLRSCTGNVPQFEWLRGELRGIAWSERELVAFNYGNNGFRSLFVFPATDIRNVRWLDDVTYAVIFPNKAETFILRRADANNDEIKISPTTRGLHIQPVTQFTVTLQSNQGVSCLSPSELLAIEGHADKPRQVTKVNLTDDKTKSRTLWRASTGSNSPLRYKLTSLFPLELNSIILGYSDGKLRRSTLPFMFQNETSKVQRYERTSEPSIDGYILSPHTVQNGRTKEHFILAGADDGSIAFWNADTLKMVARWIVFTTPLQHVLQFPDSQRSPLRGCVLCVSGDGTIAVIAVDGFQFLYVIPGAAAPLQRVCLGEDNLLLLYADQRARLWDVKTREFWRSMGADKAQEMLGQGGWTELALTSDPKRLLKPLTALNGRGPDSIATVIFDLEHLIAESTSIIKSISSSRNQTRTILLARDRLCSMLSALVTPGLNADIDEICHERLGIPTTSTLLGYNSSTGFTSLYTGNGSKDSWCISEDVSAARALALCVTLRALGLFEELSDGANTVIAFYATSLGACVGPQFRSPSLSFLALRWFDSSNELRQAARTLFDAVVVRLSDEDANMIAAEWQHGLPCLQPTMDRETPNAALALFLCGYIATEKYSLMSSGLLMDISKSISLYLNDEQSVYRGVAIDLCSRGFHVWQHYIDAMEILRALFTLATNSKKESITTQNVGGQARLAILQIASTNTPLFMTTLSLDIVTPSSLDHRKSVMQIVAFLTRKRPLVLAPNLPKLLEAVVKSLDPNSTSHRDAIIDTATEILGHVVKTFPSVDFHMSTQRLAVGTTEGAIVMYDLKNAIRLYVLEGHKHRITGCSFSPDGRRLVTLSLEDSVVLVWKVGSSFSSFFNPGAPPRQGHGGNEPFKTLPFNVGEEANVSLEGTLEFIKFEWPADRSVKIRIKQSMLTFST